MEYFNVGFIDDLVEKNSYFTLNKNKKNYILINECLIKIHKAKNKLKQEELLNPKIKLNEILNKFNKIKEIQATIIIEMTNADKNNFVKTELTHKRIYENKYNVKLFNINELLYKLIVDKSKI
jgi:hypothetical protein